MNQGVSGPRGRLVKVSQIQGAVTAEGSSPRSFPVYSLDLLLKRKWKPWEKHSARVARDEQPLPLAGSVSSDNSFNLSEPQFLCEKEVTIPTTKDGVKVTDVKNVLGSACDAFCTSLYSCPWWHGPLHEFWGMLSHFIIKFKKCKWLPEMTLSPEKQLIVRNICSPSACMCHIWAWK